MGSDFEGFAVTLRVSREVHGSADCPASGFCDFTNRLSSQLLRRGFLVETEGDTIYLT